MRVISLVVILACLGAVLPAQAHKLLVSAVPETDGIRVQVFFPDGSPAREVPVSLLALDGRLVASGKTDDQGVGRLPRVEPGQYRVQAGDPLGHLAETRLVIPGGAGPAKAAPSQGLTPAPMATGAPKPPVPAPVGEPVPWGDILAGLGFLFGVSAFIMVMKLRGEVRRLASRD